MGAGIGMAILKMVISMIASAIIQKIMAPDAPQAPQPEGMKIKSNTRSTAEPIKVIYGKQRIGGNDIYMGTADKNNKTLWIVQSLSEGTIDSIDSVGGDAQIWIDDILISDIRAKGASISYDLFEGTSTQTLSSSSLYSDFIADNPNYTDNNQYTAFILWKFTWNENIFRSVPKRQQIIKGRKLYDLRTTTTSWSDNPVLALYDFFTNERYGLGLDASVIDATTWEEAADYCDDKDFTINYVVNVGEDLSWNVINEMLRLFRGTLNFYDNKYYLVFSDLNEETSTLTIDDSMIVQDSDGKASVSINQPGRYDRPSGIRVKYTDASKDYTEDTIFIGEENGVVTSLELKGCSNKTMAGVLGTYQLERARLDRSINLQLRDNSIVLDPHDIVTFSTDSLFIPETPMRVISTSFQDNGFLNVVLQYESFELYNDSYNANLEDVYEVNLPDPSNVSQIIEPTMVEETYYYRKITYSKLVIEYTVDEYEVWFSHVEVWVGQDGSDEADMKHQFDNSNGQFEIDPVEEGIAYFVKLIPVNIWGVKASFADGYLLGVTINGVNTAPESLIGLSAIPGDNSLTLMSKKLDNPDIEAYEFRFGSQWIGGVFIGAYVSPNLSIKNIKPGFFEFTCNTLGTNGLYGNHPAYASARIPLPKGYTFFNDYETVENTGTHDNTEWFQYNSEWYLKCSHTGDVLTGTYYSPTGDIGSTNVNSYFTYVESNITVIGLGTTWGELLPSPATWNTIDPTNNMWVNIVEIDAAPSLTITIQYKEYSTDAWKDIDLAEFTSAVVRGRYYRIKVVFTDTFDTVNVIIKQPKLILYK